MHSTSTLLLSTWDGKGESRPSLHSHLRPVLLRRVLCVSSSGKNPSLLKDPSSTDLAIFIFSHEHPIHARPSSLYIASKEVSIVRSQRVRRWSHSTTMSLDAESIPQIIVLGTCTCIVLLSFFGIKKRKRLPPGPRPLPILGNINDFPAHGELEGPHWAKHKAAYGKPKIFLTLPTDFIISFYRRTNQLRTGLWEDLHNSQWYYDSGTTIGQEIVELFREARLNFCSRNVSIHFSYMISYVIVLLSLVAGAALMIMLHYKERPRNGATLANAFIIT